MATRFAVLASGSGGNATLVETNGFGVLIDVGLGPRDLARRLTAVGASWRHVHAVLLTHTHSDHWNDRTLAHLRRHGIPLICHPSHQAMLRDHGEAFAGLLADGLVRTYETGVEHELSPQLRCRPLPLPHDGGATFSFRLEARSDLFGEPTVIAYAADLGSATPELVPAFRDAAILALEFNHDIALECTSARSPRLIARVLGDHGHLSNDQAAGLLREIVQTAPPGCPSHVVQLHLSRDCNHPELARNAALAALADIASPPALHTASQDEPGPILVLGSGSPARPTTRTRPERRRSVRSAAGAPHPWLPGFEP